MLICVDVHTGHVAFTAPSASSLSESAILELLEEPETEPVIRSDDKPIESCKPSYIVAPVSIEPEELHSDLEIKLLDFGQSFTSLTRPNTLHTPLALRAPEILLQDDINYQVDLWSVGCMVSARYPPSLTEKCSWFTDLRTCCRSAAFRTCVRQTS